MGDMTAWVLALFASESIDIALWVIGRFIPTVKRETKAILWVRRWGAWALLFAWLPVVGDAIPVAAGWLRIDPLMSLLAIAVGKGIRYACVAGAVLPLVL